MTGSVWRWGRWLVLVAVLVTALVIGTHRSTPPQSLEQQTLAIAGRVRCPVCQGESAAGSDTPAATAIRQTIRADLVKGKTSAQIIASLRADYGDTILESPPTAGITLWAWIVPVVVAAIAVVGLGLGFVHWRRRSLGGSPRGGAGGSGGAPPTGVAAADERLVREALAGASGGSVNPPEVAR